MMSSPLKQVKVDNWGIYFLQRLKHFFNRTDYCDLTLQFQDNAQLKVHRLVLSACTEYFELLERTCEMYEDCLVMPDDLQADVVVPIVNFMYTGQLEFRMEILDRLHACSEIMNMPVLTKLLDSHRPKNKMSHSYSKKVPKVQSIQIQPQPKFSPTIELLPTSSYVTPSKRSYAKAFDNKTNVIKKQHQQQPVSKATAVINVTNGDVEYRPPSPIPLEVFGKVNKKFIISEPRPTRYELPEELDSDNLFENSFCNISYTSQPLMVHPDTTKQYTKRPRHDKLLPSTSKKSRSGTLDIVECKKIEKESEDGLFEEACSGLMSDEVDMFKPFDHVNIKTEPVQDPNKLFDQLLDQDEEHSTKVTIETTKNNKVAANLDHAKIISEVLKKYPHLVKSNKNIKLKIFNNPPSKATPKKQKPSPQPVIDNAAHIKIDTVSDYTYETDVIDSKQAAKLIALGAENIEGPWICLICGTPGKALHFTSYYKFRRHLVEVHNEKPVTNICEFCGQRMSKRNHLLHHMYSKHGVEPPPSHHFPKCSQCNYIALTEALLVKHKLSHSETKSFRCNVCPASFNSSSLLLAHIQNTGHKYIADRKASHQCIYCLRVFIRENNLYAHLKTHHKVDAVKDGIIDESDDESNQVEVKNEPILNEYEENNMEYHIQQKADGHIQLIPKKLTDKIQTKQTILNTGLTVAPRAAPKTKASRAVHNISTEKPEISLNTNNTGEIVMIDENEYIMSGNRLILRKASREPAEEFVLTDLVQTKLNSSQQSVTPSTSMDYTMISTTENIQQNSEIMKDTDNLSEPIPIYVSNEEEYKALMASNHNIIFDSTDSNKTLTVLTTSEARTLNNTGIDLDNSQNSDMMIIQDEYPLNVSEAVATDNSNIVVVYSQQVGDANKGYQLLTTQALGPQFAQTSGILTHNYETVSTASPVMSAHILDSPVTTWQQNINNHTPNSCAVLQSIVQTEEIPVANAPESNIELSDLPQVQLVPNSDELAVIRQIEVSGDPLPSDNLQHMPEPNDNEMKNDENIPMEDVPEGARTENVMEPATTSKSIIEHEETAPIETENVIEMEAQEMEQIPDPEHISEVETEIVRMEDSSSDTNENIVSIDTPLTITNESITNIDIPHTVTNENIESMDVQNSISNENINHTSEANELVIESIEEPLADTLIETNVEQENNAGEECTTETVQEIQTLTLEWSEEDDATSQDATDHTNLQIQACADSSEETIENIQLELKKQTKPSAETTEETLEDDDTALNDELPPQEAHEYETSTTIDPKVKISSLLNDWDDNDSQEDNVLDKSVPTDPTLTNPGNHVNPNEEETNDTFESVESQENSSTIPDKDEIIDKTPTDPENNVTEHVKGTVIKQDNVTEHVKGTVIKQDKIKSLVSDWDDDEEEEKE